MIKNESFFPFYRLIIKELYPSTKRIDNSTEVNVYRYIGVEMNV